MLNKVCIIVRKIVKNIKNKNNLCVCKKREIYTAP